ncbi:General transcription and DNA repair factor IIH subunit [Lachnellula hyalina]|uniref:General transcription and DNA repair factor IIH subunit TFB4 n=1 Tax=Lachnellula hyalina TaxID=1316788 RepID=A0A8H8QVA2_9HELO|nr:General transcription and DNA repair factor IIH subunit [Lachnellula hyalina]TVY22790.1 General transcription and DNA repair factor IIH subunit [Lachnellula hyalina]
MNAVDGSDHYEAAVEGPSPSLLVIVLDTNPHAWALLAPTLPLSKAIANILVFINAHLAVNNANQVAVVASHSHRAVWLYPRPPSSSSSEDVEMTNDQPPKLDDANKYRPFALIENSLLASLRDLISTTAEKDVATTSTTQMAGALTLALSYINKATVLYSDTTSSSKPATNAIDAPENTTGLQSRILVVSVSGDLAHQYIPIMNTTFAAQRLRIPIDILKLAGDTVFLQQASDTTKGIYMHLRSPQGLLQYLMMAFLPDQMARKHLVAPTQEVVDFRAACFCHRKVVDVGFVCSICLSIFCSPPEGAICLTCSTHLALGDYGAKPAVVPRKKKKKRRVNGGGGDTPSARGTPVPGE